MPPCRRAQLVFGLRACASPPPGGITGPHTLGPKPERVLAAPMGHISTASTSLIYRPASWVERLPLSAMFPGPAPIEVELGSGDGSFLAQWAARSPGRNFIAVERLLGRLRKLDRKARRSGLTNIRLLRIEAGYFLDYLLPPASIQALHLYFPDPWPKRKHRKNRLVNEAFPGRAARVLQPQGTVYLRTDDPEYFAQMQEVFAADSRFQPCPTPPALLDILTDFERTFHASGVATLQAAFQLQ
jgi:tRNA (guanine-N7-)-methyltransferase